ncbi:MAG: cobalt ECF transporter T component CbiQ [Candidatus Bathyarchaeia archaeon]
MTFSFYEPIRGNSPLHRIDARIKVICAFTVIFGVVFLMHWEIPLVVFGIGIGLVFYARSDCKLYFKRLLYPLYIIIFIAAIQPFTNVIVGGKPSIVVAVLPLLNLPIYQAGIDFGLLIFTRCLAAVAILNLLILITPMERIMDSLRWFKVPSVIVDTMMLMFRYISLISDESARIRKAQESRLGYSKKVGMRKILVNFGTLAGMLVARSFDRAIQVGDAMISRGYSGTSSLFTYATQKLPRKDVLIGLLVIFAMLTLVIMDLYII